MAWSGSGRGGCRLELLNHIGKKTCFSLYWELEAGEGFILRAEEKLKVQLVRRGWAKVGTRLWRCGQATSVKADAKPWQKGEGSAIQPSYVKSRNGFAFLYVVPEIDPKALGVLSKSSFFFF